MKAAPGERHAIVSFTAGPSESVTGYTVTAADLTHPSRGGQAARGAGSPITVKRLAPGHRYTFTVTATNAARATGRSSDPSPEVTIPPGHGATTRLVARDGTEELRLLPPRLRVTGLSATLTTAGGTPLDGRTVTFTNTAKSRTLCSAVTDSRGVAECAATVDGARTSLRLYTDLNRHGYLASFAGAGGYLAVQDTARVGTTPQG
ncbi:fibronectin type III domain-containing protein [Streptomyces sp. MTZ3.1]|uniref:Fibronectin type III domain-containing protein n=1 Tax=Streptomyces meridianus TaxID=2938945 RepID=A0ABT0X9S0_9ACTN|nr:fibronectin type III domain-containing protein [Streptomyces meridianus]